MQTHSVNVGSVSVCTPWSSGLNVAAAIKFAVAPPVQAPGDAPPALPALPLGPPDVSGYTGLPSRSRCYRPRANLQALVDGILGTARGGGESGGI